MRGPSIAIAVLPLLAAAGDEPGRGRGGLGAPGREDVSAAPLTFEVAADAWPSVPLRDDDVAGDRDGAAHSLEDDAELEGYAARGGEGEEEREGEREREHYDSEEGGDEDGAPWGAHEPISHRLRRVAPTAEGEPMPDEWSAGDGEGGLQLQLGPEGVPLDLDQEVARGGRDLQTCASGKKAIKVQILTDNSGFETSWDIRKSSGAVVSKGPGNGSKYRDNKQYVSRLCLGKGTYKFTVYDKMKDGMCGKNTGKGLYRFYIDGAKKFTSPANCNTKWGKRVHTFTIQGQNSSAARRRPQPRPQPRSRPQQRPQARPQPRPRPQSRPAPRPKTNLRPQPNPRPQNNNKCSNVKIQFKVDKYGKETTVTLKKGSTTYLSSVKDVGAYQTKTLQKCVPPGTYTLKLTDKDGICCKNGQGWYKMFVDGQPIVSGGYFIGSKSHTIKIGSNWQASMSARDKEWLDAHNKRRRKYNGNKGYVPLRWSRTLKADAKAYADKLVRNCDVPLAHAPGLDDGENLARNKGSGAWGEQYSADKILGRFVENELTWPYPKNAHYTQVVWRATHYVGCGESVRTIGNEKCRAQVCRYVRPGNCNVRNGNWKAEAWKDDTGCGDPCPGEGCFA